MAKYADCTIENHKQRDDEGQEKLKCMPVKIALEFRIDLETLAVGCVDVFHLEDVNCHRDGHQPYCKCSTHRFGNAQMVDGMMRMRHTHVPVCSNSHQEKGASGAVHRQHEEASIAERVSKHPLDFRDVVADTEGQGHVEHQIRHGQIEEQHRAAPPGLQVEAEDPESQTIPNDSKNNLCHQNWREDTDQQTPIEIALHVELCAVFLVSDQKNMFECHLQSTKLGGV